VHGVAIETVAMPSSRHVRMTRTAISARLAIRTFWNTQCLSDEELPHWHGP
jgi:hypothetical protein